MSLDFSIKIDEIGPEQIIMFRDPTIDMKAILAVDQSVYGTPAGGVRMAPDITVDEMVRLARAMTYKFCTYKMPAGGAKSGIWGDPSNKERKDLLITSYADSISKYILNLMYYPGPDMGTYDSDMEKIFNNIGRPGLTPDKLGMKKHGVPIEELFTGYGLIYCLEVFYANLEKFVEKKIDKTKKPSVILEGFGKVGTAIAMSLNEIGYKLTGISTLNGAVFDEEGLDIEELLKLKIQYGDDLVNRYESKNLVKLQKEKLFELSSEYSTDFIIPGARPDVINKNNINKIEAKAIVPAANIPYEPGITEVLKDKDIVELKRAINKLKKTCDAIDGDVAGFGDDWICVTPSFAQIYRAKKPEE